MLKRGGVYLAFIAAPPKGLHRALAVAVTDRQHLSVVASDRQHVVVVVRDAKQASVIATYYPLKVYAWMELNLPEHEEPAIEGGLLWHQLADGLIFTAAAPFHSPLRPNVAMLGRIADALPGVEIVGGMKTSGMLEHDGFDNLSRWAMCEGYKDEVDAAHSGGASRAFTLENETAIHKYVDGVPTETMDYEQMGEGAALFGDREIWWYPGAAGATDAIREVYKNIALWAGRKNGTGNARFVDLSYSRRVENVTDPAFLPGCERLRLLLQSATVDPVVPMFYVIPGGSPPYWQGDEVPIAFDHVRKMYPTSIAMILYPGTSGWVTVPTDILTYRTGRWSGRPI